MGMNETEIFKEIATKTQSDLMMFFILISVIILVVLLPLYKMMVTDRSNRRKEEQIRKNLDVKNENDRLEKYIQREAQIIGVIKENSEVISGLKFALENSGITTTKALDKVLANQDEILKELRETKLIVESI